MNVPVARSGLTDIVWPAMASDLGARLLGLQYQLRQSERWSAEELRAHQFAQLQHLVAHATRTMPFWRTRLREAGIEANTTLTPELWAQIPILTRADANAAGSALHCLSIPPAHGERINSSTSGSTGVPLQIAKTQMQQIYWHAFQLRDMLWHGTDFRAKNATIRRLRVPETRPGQGARQNFWDPALDKVYATGPFVTFEIRRPIPDQAAWWLREDPEYLITFSSNLALLAQHFRDTPRRPKRLRRLRGYAEVVSADLRELCREVFGVEIVDSYSSEEAGYLAVQCPDMPSTPQPGYPTPPLHVMAESALVEVLDEAGAPCAPGQVGRVVVTPLHNFAMPLLRYEIGDYAECGAACPCGRGLPVLNRVLGRTRSKVIMPDGASRAAFFGSQNFYRIPAIRQFQGVQVARDVIELRLVARRPLTPEEESVITGLVHGDLHPSFQIRFVYVDEIPRNPSGKIEDFRCEIA